MIIAILGRQPKLGLAELERLYGATAVKPIGDQAAFIDVDPKYVNGDRLGSVLKLAKPLTELPYTDWRSLSEYCVRELPKHLDYLPEGKVKLGLSIYDITASRDQLFRTGLELKKVARAAGRSLRLIPNTEPALNSAQILYNQLTSELGMELLFIKHGTKTWLAQTTWVQDVDDYARRDFNRPKRDAKVGMLPPKLAQIMLNLAGSKPDERILDPFCGTGVVLSEAALMGCQVYGTDLEPRMVDYSRENLSWAQSIYKLHTKHLLGIADATTYKWQSPLDHVVCETYLGQPLSGLPSPGKLSEIISDCDTILSKFLKNLQPQLKPGSTHCIAVPAWRVGNSFKHLPLLDRLEEMGYNRARLTHASWDDLVYHREDQIVARELLVLTVK